MLFGRKANAQTAPADSHSSIATTKRRVRAHGIRGAVMTLVGRGGNEKLRRHPDQVIMAGSLS